MPSVYYQYGPRTGAPDKDWMILRGAGTDESHGDLRKPSGRLVLREASFELTEAEYERWKRNREHAIAHAFDGFGGNR